MIDLLSHLQHITPIVFGPVIVWLIWFAIWHLGQDHAQP